MIVDVGDYQDARTLRKSNNLATYAASPAVRGSAARIAGVAPAAGVGGGSSAGTNTAFSSARTGISAANPLNGYRTV
jgi:hypothetical protein